jgi:predicted site-specific integrase-resolvase
MPTNEVPTLDREWISAKDACAYLGISFPTLKRYIRLGKLQSSQIVPNGNIRVSAISIKELLNPPLQ